MKPAKMRRRIKRLERDLRELGAIEIAVAIVTESGATNTTILRASIADLRDAGAFDSELAEIPLAGIAARSHRIYLGRRRIV